MKIKPFKLERYYTLHEFTAKYLLASSDCESMTIQELLSLEDGSSDKFQNQWLGYTESKGSTALRGNVSSIYSTINPDEVLICAGAQEPIYLFCQAILSAGDEVIVQSPCYQSVQSVPEGLGCKVLNWMVNYRNGEPFFDIDELAKLISNRTKVIFLNTPHNPTGFHFSKEQQKEIVELARKNNTIIFCDEVYRELEHDIAHRIPAFADVYENGVSLGVISKAYGLAGLRIGWLVTKNAEILEQVAIMKEYATICNSAPSEFLAGVGLRNRDKLLDRNLAIIKGNIQILDDFFEKYSDLFSWYRPFAGPISLVKINFRKDDYELGQQAIDKKSVMLLPGAIYDYPGYFRISFGRKHTPEALAQFEKFIKEDLLY
jgi:aspartate/methionine/tyrosine aminotransferase